MKTGIIALIIIGLGIGVGYMLNSMTTVSSSLPSEPSRQEQALIDEGYTEIQLGSTPFFSCSNSDSIFYNKEFTAKNVNGKEVKGSVCCGWLKGCTIRH